MVKQGPCCHCGITSTPLWRNGPSGKPVLCNACGSRWRTKGTLANYAPLHSRGFVPVDFDDYKHSHEQKSPSRKKLQNLNTISENEHDTEVGESLSRYESSTEGFEDVTSNRSSSGSGISFSESCVKLGSINGSDISGSTQPLLWDSHIPSRKRTGNKRHSPSPVEKLRRELFDIMQKQEPSSLWSSDEMLLYEKEEDPLVPVEMGLGSVLIKRPVSSAEEESEASSLASENKIPCLNDAYMESSFQVQSQSSKLSSSAGGKYKVIWDAEEGEEMMGNTPKRRVLSNTSLTESKCEGSKSW